MAPLVKIMCFTVKTICNTRSHRVNNHLRSLLAHIHQTMPLSLENVWLFHLSVRNVDFTYVCCILSKDLIIISITGIDKVRDRGTFLKCVYKSIDITNTWLASNKHILRTLKNLNTGYGRKLLFWEFLVCGLFCRSCTVNCFDIAVLSFRLSAMNIFHLNLQSPNTFGLLYLTLCPGRP